MGPDVTEGAGATGEAGATEGAGDTPDVAAIAARLRLSATRLARLLRQQADIGLTPSQLSALSSIEHHGPLTLGALAERERIAAPTVTRIVAKLEDEGFVSRTTDPTDRRSSLVTATAAGSRLLARSRQRKNAWLAAQLAELDGDQRHRLLDALDVLDALTTEPPDEPEESGP